MRIGASLLLIALGAIAKFAVTDSIKGVNLATVGIVLMIIGALGLVIELFVWGSRRRSHVVVEHDAYGAPLQRDAYATPVQRDAYGRPIEPGTARY